MFRDVARHSATTSPLFVQRVVVSSFKTTRAQLGVSQPAFLRSLCSKPIPIFACEVLPAPPLLLGRSRSRWRVPQVAAAGVAGYRGMAAALDSPGGVTSS